MTIHQPVSLIVMTGVTVAVSILIIAFLATGSFARKENVIGWVVPEAGLAEVFAQRPGVVKEVAVKLGDRVETEQALAVISTDISGPEGALVPQQRAYIQSRIAELDSQISATIAKDDRDKARLHDRARALRAEAEHLNGERVFALRQLEIVRRQLNDIQPLLLKGYISVLEKDRREQQVITAEQSLSDLDRQIEVKRSEAVEAESQARAVPAVKMAETSQLRSQRSALQSSLADLAVQDKQVARAPASGRIAAVNVRPGGTANASAPLFAIAPEHGKLVAELLTPTRAAGFIAPGQAVRIMIDAFPSERFGEIEGQIFEVSHAPTTAALAGVPVDVKESVYRVTVLLSSDSITAYGKRQPLQPGMTLKASIVTARRTFLQWLFDPLFAAARNAG